MLSTSAILSKPSPRSSVGKSSSAWKSMPSKSWMELEYSVRFKRRAVTRPGSAATLASAFAYAELIYATSASESCLRWAGSAFGRHLAGLDLVYDFFPRGAFGSHCGRRCKRQEVDPTRSKGVVVAGSTVLGNDGTNRPLEGCVVSRKETEGGGNRQQYKKFTAQRASH